MVRNAAREVPYAAFNYLVVIEGRVVAGFSEVSGLDMDTDPVEHREGAEETKARKRHRPKKLTRIVLERGYAKDRVLWEWRRHAMEGRIERRSGSIVLLYEARERAMGWSFRGGWPAKLEGPGLNAKTNEVAIEALEICAERVSLE